MSEKYREEGYLVLSSDRIRESLMEGTDLESLSEKEKASIHSRVFESIRKETVIALKRGQSVVVDATNLSRKRRMSFLEQFKGFPCVKKCVLFITPVDICLERNRNRTGSARVPEERMQRMLCNFECPNYWEGWEEIELVADSTPYQFPFEKIRGFDQDNPHHRLTLDEHIAAAVQFCKEQGYGEMLERVAAYHDIGKPYTKQYRSTRGIATPHAHYLGHDNYGAYLHLAERCCGRALSPEAFRQVLYETSLINWHMRPLTNWRWSDGAEGKDRKLFGGSIYFRPACAAPGGPCCPLGGFMNANSCLCRFLAEYPEQWETLLQKDYKIKIKKGSTYAIFNYGFDCDYPDTRIVIPYETTALYHIGIRHNLTGRAMDIDIGIRKPKMYPIHSLGECVETAIQLNQTDSEDIMAEGFVVVDGNWNRVKVKSPDYIAKHHLVQMKSVPKRECVQMILPESPEYEEEDLSTLFLEKPDISTSGFCLKEEESIWRC